MNRMIRLVMLGVGVFLCGWFITSSHGQGEVYSVNVVGFQKAPYPAGLDIKAAPFEGRVMREVVGNTGVNGTSETVADNVIVYDPVSQSYTTYYLRSHSSIGYPEWRKGTEWATNVLLYPGDGFFYRNRAGAIRTNVFCGDVVLADAVTNTINPGLQLFSYPFTTRILLSDMNLKNGVNGTSETVADNVMIYDPATTTYTTYYLRSHSSIGHPEWRVGSVWATNVYVEAGQGFWFRSRVASPYMWVEDTPYPDL